MFIRAALSLRGMGGLVISYRSRKDFSFFRENLRGICYDTNRTNVWRTMRMGEYLPGELQDRLRELRAAYFHLSERHLRKIEASALKKIRKGMYDGKVV